MNKKLRLSKNKIIAGVCGGFAEYFKIDVTIIRIIWVIFTLMTQIAPSIIIYIICWAIMPKYDPNNDYYDDRRNE